MSLLFHSRPQTFAAFLDYAELWDRDWFYSYTHCLIVLRCMNLRLVYFLIIILGQ